MDCEEDLEEGPARKAERRLKSPEKATPMKRRVHRHDEEPNVKKKVIDDAMEEVDVTGEMDMDAIEARHVDERIIGQAILGKNLHDVYSNKRIELAI